MASPFDYATQGELRIAAMVHLLKSADSSVEESLAEWLVAQGRDPFM